MARSVTIANLGEASDRRVVRRALRAGLWIWPSFTTLDAYMCFVAYPGAPFSLFVVYRIVIELGFLGVYRLSLRETSDLGRLFRLQQVMFVATAVTIALMAVHLGGIRSPYMHGISVVALVWAALVPTDWRRALPTLVGIGVAFPVVIGLGAVVSPTARAAWLTSDALVVFGSNYFFVQASCLLSLILSHMVWSAQQEARRLGSYQLEDLLGQGGMGEVWRARHRLLARSAAIKLVRSDTLGEDRDSRARALARFEREAQTTASLRSPHTIDLYDFGVSDSGTFYCVMELLDGCDAAVLVERFGPMPPERVVHLLRQVCDSLGEAHAAGLVHRDVKPSNIYVCQYGRAVDFVKVLDFGLVKPMAEGRSDLTGEHPIGGTPGYMSPEQVRGDRALDARADIYAVGCVAYRLLTGRHVFEGRNAMQMMVAHVHGTPEPPSRYASEHVPPELDALILACLAKQPADRPQTADALAAAFARIPLGQPWTDQRARDWWQEHLSSRGVELRSPNFEVRR